MLETPHALVGAAIATKIPNPAISLPLAFASHFVLDMVPHWNPHLNTELKRFGKVTSKTTLLIVCDVVLALVLGSMVAVGFANSEAHTLTILLGAFCGVAPDVIEAPYFFMKWKNKLLAKFIAFQKSIQVDTTVIPGLLTQLITLIAAVLWAGS